MDVGKEINRGGEFKVYELGSDEVLKIPRFKILKFLIFGDFRGKNEKDLKFLQNYFPDYIPRTEIVSYENAWAIRQDRIDGHLFSTKPVMNQEIRSLFMQAETVYLETGSIPDISNPNNLFIENGSGRPYIVDTSVLGHKKWWPIGFIVTRLLGAILFDSVQRWLKTGFKYPEKH